MRAHSTYLYLIEVLTYGVSHPIKVGISKDLRRRILCLRDMGISCPKLLGTFEFPIRLEALRIESLTHKAFRDFRCRDYKTRETFSVDENALVSFISQHAPSPYVRADS